VEVCGTADDDHCVAVGVNLDRLYISASDWLLICDRQTASLQTATAGSANLPLNSSG